MNIGKIFFKFHFLSFGFGAACPDKCENQCDRDDRERSGKFDRNCLIQCGRTEGVERIPGGSRCSYGRGIVDRSSGKDTEGFPAFWLKIQAVHQVTGRTVRRSIVEKEVTEIACATSSSSASMTGAVAAIAEPPQMEDPTPTSVEIFPGTCITLCNRYAMIRDVEIVVTIIGSDCFPVPESRRDSVRNREGLQRTEEPSLTQK